MKSFAEDGDYVILFSTHENLIKVKLTDAPGTITQYKGGKFKHQDIIGKRFGSRVPDHRNPNITAVLLPWTPELHSLSLDHRTQIVWGPDLSLISAYLDLRAGYTLVESGTGSGSASVNFARQLASGGHLHTFEFHSDRYLKAVKEFEDLGLGDVITCYNRNAYEDGFSEVKEGHPEFGTAKQKGVGKEEADGVFLDLPSPWLALAHADYILKPSCRVVIFSPCFEQVQTVSEELRKMDYDDILGFEVICKPLSIWTPEEAKRKAHRLLGSQQLNYRAGRTDRPPMNPEDLMNPETVDCLFQFAPYTINTLPLKGHTGYVVVASKGPSNGGQPRKNNT